MARFAAYGTLRKGSYNYARFKDAFNEGFNYVKTITVEVPYKMYNLGSYPGLIQSDTPTEIVFDIIECSSTAYNHVTRMEVGAGYKVETIMIENEELPIFVYKYATKGEEIQDWIEYEKLLA